jgi:hypothetical protein
MREFFDLANNPLFVKHVRSRLRRSAVLPGMIVIVFLSMCIVFINNYIARGPNNPEPDVGSHMFFWLQGILLVLMGGSQVASAIAQMKESGIIDFHRITPVPPSVQTIGIMLGAPIRELILYATTLPFAIFLAIDGPIGVTNFAKLFLVQLGSALMYYSLAMITGLTGGKARGASGRFVAILAGLNIMASTFFEHEIYGPTLITSMPVYIEVFTENDQAQAKKQQAAQQRRAAQQPQAKQAAGPNQPAQNLPPLVEPKREVTFYGLALPLVLQSLMFQGGVLTFLFIAASRRIHSARMPLYRKPTALLFMVTMSALTLGSLWSTRTLLLTLGAGYFLTLFAIILSNTVTPSLGDLAKGVQRARKLSGLRVPVWSDLSSNKLAVWGLAFLLTATVAVGIVHSQQKPQLDDFAPWPSLLVGCLSLLTYGFASQYFAISFGNRAKSFFVLFIFFAWIVPIIIGMLARASQIREGDYFLALSPIIGVLAAGDADFAIGLDQTVVIVASVGPVSICAVLFFFMLIAEERRLRDKVVAEHERRERRHKEREHEHELEVEQ